MTTYTVGVLLAHPVPDHQPDTDFRQFRIPACDAAHAIADGETQACQIAPAGWVLSGHAVAWPTREVTP